MLLKVQLHFLALPHAGHVGLSSLAMALPRQKRLFCDCEVLLACGDRAPRGTLSSLVLKSLAAWVFVSLGYPC